VDVSGTKIIYIIMSMIFMFKMVHNMLPVYFKCLIKFNYQVHRYSTRDKPDLNITKVMLSRTMNSIFCKGIKENTMNYR
jgi:hypothetical protein